MAGQDMTLTNAALQKAAWHEASQQHYAQNIANADTPGYQPTELKPMDFKKLLGSSTSTVSLGATGLSTTNAKHITSSGGSASSVKYQGVKQKEAYEVSPSGNAVVLEEQLMKASENMMEHDKAISIYQKNLGLLQRALRDQ